MERKELSVFLCPVALRTVSAVAFKGQQALHPPLEGAGGGYELHRPSGMQLQPQGPSDVSHPFGDLEGNEEEQGLAKGVWGKLCQDWVPFAALGLLVL